MLKKNSFLILLGCIYTTTMAFGAPLLIGIVGGMRWSYKIGQDAKLH